MTRILTEVNASPTQGDPAAAVAAAPLTATELRNIHAYWRACNYLAAVDLAIMSAWRSGKFSSDRTIAEYASAIWGAAPCEVI